MTVTVNGERLELGTATTVDGALRELGVEVPERGLAVAIEGEVVPRGRWAETALREGQRLEVVRAVGGG